MKTTNRMISMLLAFVMISGMFSGCANDTKTDVQSSVPADRNPATSLATEANGAPIPSGEFERGIWYGFLPEELAAADPDNTIVTWKQYCAMLGSMIARYKPETLAEWESMTKDAPDTEMKRDGAAIALLYAAKTVDLHYSNRDGSNVYHPDYGWGEHFSWDYPIFDWQNPIQLFGELAEHYDTSNAIGPSYWFILGKISCISFQPMLELVGCDPNLEGSLTCRDAIVSVVRLYESVETVVLDVAAKMLERVLQTEEGQQIVAEAEARKAEILNSETKIVKSDTFVQGETYTGTAYYVSNSGNDAADGKSPETAWASIDRLASAQFQFGDAIFFERGGVWRKASLPGSIRYTEGLTLSAYGEGEKPKLIGSPENGTGEEKWTLYYEGPNGEKIWKFYTEMTDCSAIVLNGTETFKRDLAYWDGSSFLCIEDFSIPYSMETQMRNMELFVELPYTQDPFSANFESYSNTLGIQLDKDENGEPLTGPLYVRCDQGNPGELFDEIEFIAAYTLVGGMADHTTLDNLCFSHSTYTIAVGYFNGESQDNVIIQNCEAGWLGGALKWFAESQNAAGFNHAFMDGGGLNANGSNETIENCYVHHCFQEAGGIETFEGDNEDSVGNIIRNNVIEYCPFGLTAVYRESDEKDSVVRDTVIESNYVLYSGMETLYNYLPIIKDETHGNIHWPIRVGYLIADSAVLTLLGGGENYRITGNTFAFSVSQLFFVEELDKHGAPLFEGNTYAVLPSFAYTGELENPWGPLVADHDVARVIGDFLGDKTATIITFE